MRKNASTPLLLRPTVLILLGMALVAAWMWWPRLISYYSVLLNLQICSGKPISCRPYKLEELGQLGDSFGAFNALISGFGFVVLAATLRLQMKEIAAQRQEFEEVKKREDENRRRDTTFALFDEFHTHLNKDRNEADRLLMHHPNQDFKQLDAMYNSGHFKNTDFDCQAVWNVMRFFQRLWLALDNERLDRQLTAKLFGELTVWWHLVYYQDKLYKLDWDAAQDISRLNHWLELNSKQSDANRRSYDAWVEKAQNEIARRKKPQS